MVEWAGAAAERRRGGEGVVDEALARVPRRRTGRARSASPAAMAADSVQPVPCVAPDRNARARRTDARPRRRRSTSTGRPGRCPPFTSAAAAPEIDQRARGIGHRVDVVAPAAR